MNDELENAYETFQALVDTFTPAEAIKRLELMGVSAEVVEHIRAEHERQVRRIKELEEPHAVVRSGRETWYTGPHPTDKCWPGVKNILVKDGWGDAQITSLDESSTRVVSLLDHPKEKAFDTRGLVVGYVQSGKTTNFTSVMAKAADRGYKLFIVLAGIHNGLRRQTQARLVQQLIEPNPSMWSQLTGLDKDFTPHENPASYFGKNNRTKVLCVVKKNASVLRKLSQWLDKASDHLRDCPALIIDDEADQATVATNSINPLILQIMGSLPRSAYVGYTASPFANLLIDPAAEDLYPEDFVVNLPKPRGHFGTEVLFGRHALDGEDPETVDDGHDMIRSVPESDIPCVRPATRADIPSFVPAVTEAMREAVEYFWLATAARRVRAGGNPHNTMLVHTSVNTSVHNSFREPLEQLRERTAEGLGDEARTAGLRALWDRETARVRAEDFGETKVPFEKLQAELPAVLAGCRIVMDNSSSEDRLDYENGPVVAIAVGGNTLSRGLTLEGLSVSYFVRAVSAYDTLLQMGRWFGFRNGYADLPRIWMTDELAGWFRHLATVETEMRRDIDVYMTRDESPRTFAVRLRTHPSLRVTAAAKMRDAVVAAAAYGGQRVQTTSFPMDAARLRENLEAARGLVEAAFTGAVRLEDRSDQGRWVMRDVPHEVVTDFLDRYSFHARNDRNEGDLVKDYIAKRISTAGSLRRWNVAVVGTPDGEAFHFTDRVAVGLNSRSRLSGGEAEIADIKTLMSRRDAAVDLAGNTGSMNEEDIKVARSAQLPDHGLLVLYPIDRHSVPADGKTLRAPLNAPEEVIGVGLVFPRPVNEDSTVTYVSANLAGVQLEEPEYDQEGEGA